MKFLRLIPLVVIGMVWATTAVAEEKPGQWYITPAATGVWTGSSRSVSDEPGVALIMGKAVTDGVNLEAIVQASNHDGANGQASQDIFNVGFRVLRVWYRDSRLSPYLLLGLDWIDVDSPNPAWDAADTGTSLGFGVLSDLTRSGRVALRTELLMRTQFSDVATVNDMIATLGVQFALGSSDEPVAAAPVDSDGDGVIDTNDRCPGTPQGRVVDSQGCELDSDGDGVVDGVDQCPNTPAGAPVDEYGCPLDTDGDGVADYEDNCPDTPKGDPIDKFGCTLPQEITLHGVNFELNSADLTSDSSALLDEVVAGFERNPGIEVEVAGYTDSTGEESYNLGLSQRRAESVMNHLVEHGVPADQLTARGYGEENPVASNANDAGRAENRRVTLRILDQ